MSGLQRVGGRRRWREAEARAVLEAWRRSGTSLASFAERRGIQRARLERWARRLGVSSGGVRFHRVRVVERSRRADETVHAGSPIEIEWTPGRRLRVLPGFAAEDLARVLDVLDRRDRC